VFSDQDSSAAPQIVQTASSLTEAGHHRLAVAAADQRMVIRR
jgi:hypothetical protein